MKKCIYLIFALLIFSACKNESKKPSEAIQNETEKVEFSIIIHGGAGSIRRDNMSEEREAEYRQKLEEAIRVGYTILKEGGTSLDAVQNTINILEDSPLFNGFCPC